MIYIYDWSAQRAQQRIPWFFFRLRIAASFVCLVIILVIWSIFKHVRLSYQLPNWWAPWNLSCLEFKFDDTRLSYWHKNKIGRTGFFLLLLDFANSLPCWLSQQNWAGQQGRKLAKSGSNKNDFNSANLVLILIGKPGIIRFEFQTA